MRRLVVIMVVGAAGAAAVFALLTESRPPPRPIEEPPAIAPSAPPITPKGASAPRAAPTPARPIAASPVSPPAAEVVATTGTLVIESDVPETSVFIDRVYLGNAPVTVPNLAPGPHRLNMSVTGYEGIAETIEVAAGTHTISIKFKEITLDERLAATHKHGIGSCAGTLRATPQGLTYDTTNADDAFTAPLTSLEVFEVDYVGKNLRVKIRGGNTYNFTDPEGNADRLYLFHQAVGKVRQRLMSGK